ncbi:hydrogenase formation protein HypD [Streptomyces sp. NPDC005921]
MLDDIRATVTRPWALMEVCGGQTHSIIRHGIDQLLPEEVELIHGPGCPVCVTPLECIDKALEIAARPDVVFCSFGDMLRVPGTDRDLFRVKGEGGDVRVVYSPLDALQLARRHPDKQVVFFAIGFETTAPANAMAVHQARRLGLTNFTLLVSHVRVPPAVEAIMTAPACRVQGFLAAGHVCSVMGMAEYPELAERHRVPIVVKHLEREGFRKVHILRGVEEAESATVVTEKRFNDLTHLTGPFDIVGDIHGCASELESLLAKLGYADGVHPDGRTAVFVGDLVDRGPDSPGVLRRVMSMVGSGNALCVPGNHENKYGRYLKGRKVQHTHGLAETIEQMDGESEEFTQQVREFIDGLVSHYVLDGGNLVVCHAGLPEKYHGRTSGRVRSHALYGDTTGETDEFGLPVRYPWAEDYRGRAAVVYGHTPVPEASWLNNTICLDTGAVFGGKLTALRWPERELVDVPAERVWYEPARPLRSEAPGGQDGRPLDLADVQGRRVVETRYQGRIAVREENAAAALEVMTDLGWPHSAGFAAELAHSVASLALSRADREIRPKEWPDRDWEWEQRVVDGHPFHPNCRSRPGFSVVEELAYGPEHRPVVRLEAVPVATGDCLLTGEWPDELRDSGRLLIPVHPWQSAHVLKGGSAGPWREAHPLLSLRTLALPGGPHVKTALSARLTSSVRDISTYSVGAAVTLSAFATDLASHTGGLLHITRTLGAATAHSPDLAALLRESPQVYAAPGERVLPVAALATTGLPGSPSWLAEFTHLALTVGLRLLDLGVALEAHGQNLLVVLSETGRPLRLVYRDLADIRLSPARLTRRGITPPDLTGRLVTDDETTLRRKLFGSLVAGALAATAGSGPALATALEAAVRTLPATPDLTALLESPLPAKALTLMRLSPETPGDRWAALPNPLVGTL